MKKIALCLSLGTLLLSGVGCGDMNADQTEGQGAFQRDQTGYGVDRDGTGMGAANYGQQGRETERFGQRQQGIRGYGVDQRTGQGAGRGTGLGTGQRTNMGFRQGIVGDDRPGMVDENGLLNGTLGGFNRQTTGQGNRGTDGQDQMHGGTAIPRNQPGQQAQDGRGYFDTNDGRMARKIENRVEDIDGVRNADVIVHEDDIIVGVDTTEDNQQIEQKVRSMTTKMNNDKQVHVVTEDDGVETIHGMERQLRAGEPFEEVGATFNAMLDDLGDAIQRPFERTR
ncbi:YhcN/YlaJ family sporulation lipoprotein [Salipaludibacillus daqingensis]|uniref:YhcN/YlaJ family sporulation lipoprotein n=1 Tax=Salipaludibacillus daqingensis TaxID=3041001 RepID=UPI002473A9BA|nr:YhcN/YlaJ family sporulation lipoprotein [Salipaludibacillus daqingensis]